MKKLLFLMCAVGMLSFAAMAQKANYSGTWNLDVPNSKLDARQRIESMTMTVKQTDKDLSVETATKRLPPNDAPAGPPPGGGGGMGGGRGMGMGGGDSAVTYSLDGKETKTEVEGPMGKMPITHKASIEADGSVKLSSSRTFNGPNGEITSTTTEIWKLSADGKTLTVNREASSPRGSTTSTLVFTKK
ncbi:MAG: hypothetical protein KIT61_09940 [Pyrinomonadaceae bacterium]|jgi:hypothetical protein|nr:hypothetical protein [Blastocatellia bacterium]MCW5956897.1 hypothetical protein [Pyrinomonadaceae bacterium]